MIWLAALGLAYVAAVLLTLNMIGLFDIWSYRRRRERGLI